MKRVLAHEKMGWEPHYNDVQKHVTIPKGTEVTVIDDVFEPWDHQPDPRMGHTYWCFRWKDKDGGFHETWTRTYAHVEISPLFEPESTPDKGEDCDGK
jgi:hypothetical protein